MATRAEIESLVLKLPECDLARLAADWPDSLPEGLAAEDEGLDDGIHIHAGGRWEMRDCGTAAGG